MADPSPPFSPITFDIIAALQAVSGRLRTGFGAVQEHLGDRTQCEAIAARAQTGALRRLQAVLARATATREGAGGNVGFLLEDSAETVAAEHLFVIDPLDGQLNYTAGLPLYAAGVAYFYRGILQASAIVQPQTGRIYAAERGRGAYLLAPRRVPQQLHAVPLPLRDCVCDIPASPPHTIRGLLLHGVNNISPQAHAMRMTGSSLFSLCCIAGNSLQAVCRRLQVCDVAPGLLIVQEAGAVALDIDGIPFVLNIQYPQKRALTVICHPALASELLTAFHRTPVLPTPGSV